LTSRNEWDDAEVRAESILFHANKEEFGINVRYFNAFMVCGEEKKKTTES